MLTLLARIAALAWVGLQSSAVRAEALSEQDYLGELPVVLSVSRLAQPLDELPGAVTVIDAETIRRSGAREVAELLRLVPGFLVTRRNGGSTIAAYHSALDIYGARMQVYVDGRSVYSSFYLGDTHRGLAAVDLADVDRIEVLRGSNSAAFGSNAFLGVVNIVTRAAADTHGVSVAVRRGEGGIEDNYLRVGWGNETAHLRLTVSGRADKGFDALYDDTRRAQVQLRGDFRPGPADEFSIKAGSARDAFGEGFPRRSCRTLIGAGFCDDNKERTDAWRNAWARLDWVRDLGNGSMLRFAGGVDQEQHSSFFVADQFPNAPAIRISTPFNAGGRSLRHNLEIQRSDTWQHGLRTVIGAEALREEVRSNFLFSTDASLSASIVRGFGGVEWRPAPDWVFNTGGLWEVHSLAGKSFAPRLAVNFHLTPLHTLRAVATQSYRAPSIYMYRGKADFIVSATPALVAPFRSPYVAATGQVRAETMASREIGYLGTFPAAGLKLDGRLFAESMNRRIWVSGLDFVNTQGPAIHGLEYRLDWRPFSGLRVVLGEAHLRQTPGRDRIDEHFETPHRTGSLAAYLDLPYGFDLSLTSHYATSYQWAGMAQLLDRVRQLDARLAYAIRAGATRGELALTVQSVAASHMEYQRSQIFGPRAFASLRLDF